MTDPPAGTAVVPLALALSLTAGAVNGTAVALARAGGAAVEGLKPANPMYVIPVA